MEQSPRMMYVLAGVFSALPLAAVALRFIARRRTKAQLLWDDWIIVFSLVACVATAMLIIIGAAAGRLAQHSADAEHVLVEDERFFVFAKAMFAMELTQILSIGPTKLSVLFLYHRLFGRPSPTFSMLNLSLMALTFVWTVSFFFANVFKCSPVDAEIVPNPPDTFTCIDETKMFLAQAWSDVGLDVLILALPLPMIYRMHLPWNKKLGVFCMFLLGALTTAASITKALYQSAVLRIYDEMFAQDIASQDQDITWYLTPMLYWPFIESSLGIVGACLPLYRPLADTHWIKSVVRRIQNLWPEKEFQPVDQDSQHSSAGDGGSGSDGAAPKVANANDDAWLRAYHDREYDGNGHEALEFQTLRNDIRV